ncbi:MAG: bifunctional DNA-formamidopyrimidine glycosylase/DNA-(apurinic or apyrimidinic site) lyase [Bacillota bacterium]|nr:bifunctional DNA-formamidopyrimidine glycosylase/DNA-(apurinic or apyrimidinic site) lyase [Bacillota bacterium]
MPELPEVETVRRSLLACIKNLSITAVNVRMPKLIQNLTAEEFSQAIIGRTVRDIERRGKYLMVRLSGEYTLVIHLRMTGQLRYSHPDVPELSHTHIVIYLSDGNELRYTDIRQFGFWFLAPDDIIDQVSRTATLGPEPLEDSLTIECFSSLVIGKKGCIKALLLNQQFVAGVGNIYADEALFGAGVHPERKADTLTSTEIEALYHSMRHVLAQGVRMRGTSFSDYVDGLGESGSFQHELKVYGRAGEACAVCTTPITRLVVAGRGTHICPNCQK